MRDLDLDEFFASNMVPMGTGIAEALELLRAMQSGKLLRVGIDSFDEEMRLIPGELIFIGGRAASGKTALGMQIVRSVADQIQQRPEGERGLVCVFSAEMPISSLLMRQASVDSEVTLKSLVNGRAGDSGFKAIEEALHRSRMSPSIFVDQSPAPTLEHMVEQLVVMSAVGKVELVVFDYLELAGEYTGSPQERVTKISRGLKSIAKKFKVPVVVLAQLNREIEKRPDKKVQLSDFMFGGEQAADIAIGLLRPHLYDLAQPASLVEAHICKYRNGPTGVLDLVFDENTMTFSSGRRTSTPLNT